MALILTKVRNRFLFRLLPFNLRFYKVLLLFSLCQCASLFSQTKVEILGGERMYGDQTKNLLYIVQNVVLKHNGIIIQCDSAIRKTDEGIIEGFGNIYIYQQDTFTLSGGDYLRYDEETKTAQVTGKNVILKDQQMTLLTTSLQYNTAEQLGYYTNGADILSDKNTLKSKRGYYSRRGNVFHFKDDVKLTGADYTMQSDTLDYFAGNRTAFFYGPTRIVSKENTIVCNYGWYNTKTEKAQFSRRATIYSDSSYISADSLLYDKKETTGVGIGNIRMYDSSENVEVFGQYGLYLQKSKSSIISGSPLVIKADSKDTMYLMADTFHFINDSLNKMLRAYRNTSILQKEFQGHCDSMVYSFSDSVIHLYYAPILWSEKNQITGDTMHIRISNHTIKNLKVMQSAFLASEVKPGYYNQISGREMINDFDSNALRRVLVEGNAQSIYYIRDNETDSAEYTGVNKVTCGKMLIGFDSSKVKSIRFYSAPEGKMYPVSQFPEAEKHLPGLVWKIDEKPVLQSFLERQKVRLRTKPADTDIQPEKKPSSKKKKKKK